MIRDRDCPRCYAPMRHEIGMDEDGNVREIVQCTVCVYGYRYIPEPHTPEHIRRAVAAVAAIRNVEDLDKRAEVLAEHGFTMGRRYGC